MVDDPKVKEQRLAKMKVFFAFGNAKQLIGNGIENT